MRALYQAADWLRHKRRLRIWTAAHASGRRAEDLAHRLLRKNGLVIVARNYRARSGSGEIDLIAREGPVLVFVEVKARSSVDFGTPDRAVDGEKQAKILRAASEFVRRSGADPQAVRFDIVTVVFGETIEVMHLADAFGYSRSL
jgi:TIGR00252 family protein